MIPQKNCWFRSSKFGLIPKGLGRWTNSCSPAKASLKRRPKRTLSRGFGTGGRTSLRWRSGEYFFLIRHWSSAEYGWFPSRFMALFVGLSSWVTVLMFYMNLHDGSVGLGHQCWMKVYPHLLVCSRTFEESCCNRMLFARARWRPTNHIQVLQPRAVLKW